MNYSEGSPKHVLLMIFNSFPEQSHGWHPTIELKKKNV